MLLTSINIQCSHHVRTYLPQARKSTEPTKPLSLIDPTYPILPRPLVTQILGTSYLESKGPAGCRSTCVCPEAGQSVSTYHVPEGLDKDLA